MDNKIIGKIKEIRALQGFGKVITLAFLQDVG
jgi:hypothetical protein